LSGYLLDTSVLSAFAPDRPPLSQSFQTWLSETGRLETWYVPVVAAAEIQRGVAKLRRSGGAQRAERLERWLDRLLVAFGERALHVDSAVARRAGEIDDMAVARGRYPGFADILIAATAAEHGLTVLTANNRHFTPLGIANFNPFAVE
jgi:predicted nucleic acid-binding protein